MLKEWRTVLGLIVLAWITPASGDESAGKRLVEAFVTDVVTLQGTFEQSLTDAEGEVVERTSGTLEVDRPGRFRWSTSLPYEHLMLADGLNIWNYDMDLAQVQVKPQAEAIANTPALLLGGSADALDQFEFGETTVETETTWVRLEPKDKNNGFTRVEMGFMDGQLRRMIFFDHLEQMTFVALENVKVNEPIDDGRFRFEVPEDADVVGVPAVSSTN